MTGTLISLFTKNNSLQGTVLSEDGTRYSIYFPNDPSGVRKNQSVNFNLRTSQAGRAYAVFVSIASPSATNVSDVTSLSTSSSNNVNVNEADDKYKTVTELNDMIKNFVSANSSMRNICVKGEVTNYSGPSKMAHYFSIKDSSSIIKCILWKTNAESILKFALESGKKVGIVGYLDFYSPNGEIGLYVTQITELGVGEAKLARLALIEKLRSEGLFDRKRPIPVHPNRIGLVTSSVGRAKGDMQKLAREHNPYVVLELYGITVQGKNAPASIVTGIQEMDKRGYDVLIVGRGGGSEEELSCFDDESVARAIFATKTPVISAVGHEDDMLISDMVADRRSATPSHAVTELIPNVVEEIKRVKQSQEWLNRSIKNIQLSYRNSLNIKKTTLEKNSPIVKLKERSHRLEVLVKSLNSNIGNIISDKKHTISINEAGLKANINNNISKTRQSLQLTKTALKSNFEWIYYSRKSAFEKLVVGLNALSPTAKLINGFGYISTNDKPVTSVDSVSEADELKITLHDGEINTIIKSIDKKALD